jgi:hypothetical protein
VGEAAGGTGALAGAGVVTGEPAAVASFLDLFFGVALAAGVALATGASGLGAGLAALCDLFFGVAEAAGVGLAVCEYASGEAAIANRARSERNLRIRLFYLDFTPLGNPGSERNTIFRRPGSLLGAPSRSGGRTRCPQVEKKMAETGPGVPVNRSA